MPGLFGSTVNFGESEPGWLGSVRRESEGAFERLPLEQSAYTVVDVDFGRILGSVSAARILRGGSALHDGAVFADILSAQNHPLLRKLLAESVPDDKFAALNRAAFSSGTFLYVPKGACLSVSQRLLSQNSGFSRSIIVVDSGAQLDFTEELASEQGNFFHSDVTEVYLGDGASLNFVSVQDFSQDATFISHRKAVLGRNSSVSWNLLNAGSGLAKCRRETFLDGEGASVLDVEVVLARNRQHIDSSITAVHNAPNTASRVIVKAALDESAQQVAYGMVKIAEKARGSNSFLEEHSILLSSSAKSDSIPALEILTNDVRAKHAATCAPVDEEKLFYLCSRGLSKHDAKRLVVDGFIGSAVSQMKGAHIDAIRRRSEAWMQGLSC
ncbi:Fe-S cluster assembly protein SufD [Candidatus Woesearchaeota archaeon]|nr:Fe-S cluster assembly protein SufD [Candidatus Woesearchaeota archaeon]